MTIRCAVCKREVDFITSEYDPLKRVTIYVAECHGDREVVRLSDSDRVGATSISIGEAFSTKSLPG